MGHTGKSNEPTDVTCLQLREIASSDLATLFRFESDEEANRMAAMRPRSRAEFDSHWNSVLEDPGIAVKAIVVGDELVGKISCFRADGIDFVGYWIGRQFWGMGIATRATSVFLDQVSIRPLHARVAISNPASIRVLTKNGFRIVRYQHSPASDRYLECEEALLELNTDEHG